MSLNYNIIDTFKLLGLSFKSSMFISLLISAVVLYIILVMHKDRKVTKYVVIVMNILLIFLILYYYIGNILSISNPINNIYFYMLNSMLFLIIISLRKNNKVSYLIYCLSLLNIIYSLYMTYCLDNATVIVIGNIFPMIKFGNIIYIIYYLVLIVKEGKMLWKKKLKQ